MTNNMIILDTWWHNTGGVVLVQDNVTYEYKAYIKDLSRSGPLEYPYVLSQADKDSLNIASWGDKIPKAAIHGFFPSVILDETKPAREVNPGYFL